MLCAGALGVYFYIFVLAFKALGSGGCVTADGGVRPNRGLGLCPSWRRAGAVREPHRLCASHSILEGAVEHLGVVRAHDGGMITSLPALKSL